MRLSADDGSLRCSAGVVADDMVRAYVTHVRLGHDLVFCLINRDYFVVGLAHGCAYRCKAACMSRPL